MYCLTCVIFAFILKGFQATNQPNIVLILADDLGWNDVSYHGSNQIPTPNIDALAYNGMILNRFYTQPTCTPSRSALLTGQYPIRIGFQGYVIRSGENRFISHDVKLLPEKLKELGYKTNLIGKWHLGAAYKNVTPTYRGFDYHFGFWYGFIGYFNHFSSFEHLDGLDMHDNLTPSWSTQYQYATHLFTHKAEQIISTHNTSQPLFLMLSHLAPHAGQPGVVYEVPDNKINLEKFHYIKNEKRRKYAGMVDELDKSVGIVIKSLAQKRILDNTIILFLSDNGAQTIGSVHTNSGSNWPLRGVKFTCLEGGIRNVGILYYSKLKEKGITYNGFLHISDWFPTLISAAGGYVDEAKLDGIDQWNTLLNNQESKRKEILVNIENVENWSAYIGAGRFKLVNNSGLFNDSFDSFYGDDGRGMENPPYNVTKVLESTTNLYLNANLTSNTILRLRQENEIKNLRFQYDGHRCDVGKMCLFDIVDDPCETTNVIDKYTNIAKELSEKLSHYWQELCPQKNQLVDYNSDPINFNKTWTTWLDL